MSYWNHRVIKEKLDPRNNDWYTIREVYYNDDGSIFAYYENSATVEGESIEELRETLTRMLNCLDREVLIDGEVEFTEKD